MSLSQKVVFRVFFDFYRGKLVNEGKVKVSFEGDPEVDVMTIRHCR